MNLRTASVQPSASAHKHENVTTTSLAHWHCQCSHACPFAVVQVNQPSVHVGYGHTYDDHRKMTTVNHNCSFQRLYMIDTII